MAHDISQSSEAGLAALMTLLSLIAYSQLSRLDVNIHPISFLDDLLLFICLPFFFLSGIISLVPALFPAHGDTAHWLDIAVPVLLVRDASFVFNGTFGAKQGHKEHLKW